MDIKKIAVIGSGTMGNGIAHTFAQFGYSVLLIDIKQEFLNKGIETITKNIDRQVRKGTLTEEQKTLTLSNIKSSVSLSDAKDCELVIGSLQQKISGSRRVFLKSLIKTVSRKQ